MLRKCAADQGARQGAHCVGHDDVGLTGHRLAGLRVETRDRLLHLNRTRPEPGLPAIDEVQLMPDLRREPGSGHQFGISVLDVAEKALQGTGHLAHDQLRKGHIQAAITDPGPGPALAGGGLKALPAALVELLPLQCGFLFGNPAQGQHQVPDLHELARVQRARQVVGAVFWRDFRHGERVIGSRS